MALFDYSFETGDIVILLTLVLLEGVLSFDNAAVLAAMVRKLPMDQRRKALLYGLAGAYIFRIIAILSVAFIIRYPVLKLIGGLYLIYLALKHLVPGKNPHSQHVENSFFTRIGISGFWGIVIAVEMADAVFALDQILVAVAMTPKTLLIIIAALFAILALRLSAVYIGRLMDWFPVLEKLAYAAVGFVGLKLVAVEIVHYLGYHEFEVPKLVSVGVTLALLVIPVVVKLVLGRIRRRPASTAE